MKPATLDRAARTDVAYFVHQVGADGSTRDTNILRALRWFEFLVDATEHQISAPWLAYVMALREATHRDRGMHDGARMIERTALRVGFVCGSAMSPGCHADVAKLRAEGVGVVDLTPMGLDLPPTEIDDWRVALAGLVALAAPVDCPRWESRAPIFHVQAINSYTIERPWV